MLAYCGDSDDEKSSLDSIDFPSTTIAVNKTTTGVDSFDTIPKDNDDKLQIMIECDATRHNPLDTHHCIQIISAILSIGSILYTAMKGCTSTSNMPYVPVPLLELGKYRAIDFQKRKGVSIPYWQDMAEIELQSTKYEDFPRHVGPCYLPRSEPDWNALITENKQLDSEKKVITYRSALEDGDKKDLAGLCRPGFIIIGAGKCGTSSLYHYLTGHPRVLAAKNKQIDYYRYFGNRSMKWYLSNFPIAEHFLSSGALMTGEASPGYLVRVNFVQSNYFSSLSTLNIFSFSPTPRLHIVS
jgi:hypothetical protein